ncbi:MAG: hypothetical protein WCQ21_11695, partial [Verrucomicrobiota bacterium]
GGSVSPAAPFPLTPARSPKERENYRPRGDKSKQPDISHDDRQGTLSWGEGWGEVASKAEARRRERRPSSGIRRPKPGAEGDSGFGFLSAFGFAPLPPARPGSNF